MKKLSVEEICDLVHTAIKEIGTDERVGIYNSPVPIIEVWLDVTLQCRTCGALRGTTKLLRISPLERCFREDDSAGLIDKIASLLHAEEQRVLAKAAEAENKMVILKGDLSDRKEFKRPSVSCSECGGIGQGMYEKNPEPVSREPDKLK